MCCTTGRPATGSSPFGTPRESGRSRVASPATGTTAVVMATGDGRLVPRLRASSARVVRAASWALRGAYCRIEGKEGGGGRARVPLRGRQRCPAAGRRVLAHFARLPQRVAPGRASVFPRLDGVGPTFDAGSPSCCETRAIAPPRRTRLRTTTRAPNRRPSLPSMMLFAPTARASGDHAAAAALAELLVAQRPARPERAPALARQADGGDEDDPDRPERAARAGGGPDADAQQRGDGRRPGAVGQPRARDGARGILRPRRGRGRQVVEQALEVALGTSGVGRVEALLELLRREPSGRRVRAERPRDVLALGVRSAYGGSGWLTAPMLGGGARKGAKTASCSPRPAASVATHTTG